MKKKTLLIFLCRVHGHCSLSSNVPTVDSVESWWLEFEGEILSKCFIGINVNTRTNRCSCSRSVSYYYYNFLSETSRWYPVDIVPLGCTIFYVLKFIFYFYFLSITSLPRPSVRNFQFTFHCKRMRCSRLHAIRMYIYFLIEWYNQQLLYNILPHAAGPKSTYHVIRATQ